MSNSPHSASAGNSRNPLHPSVRSGPRRFDPRQAMNRPDYEIFHYHDKQMPEVPLHHHDYYEVYYFLRGRVEYLVEGRSYTLLPDDVLLISPMELHRPSIAPEADYERLVLWISRDCLSGISDPNVPLHRCFLTGQNLYHAANTPIDGLILRLAEEAGASKPAAELSSRGLFLQVMAEVFRLVESSRQNEEPRQETPLVAQVLDYIGEHYAEALSLDTLAERFYVSKYYLSHLFCETVGTSIYRYVILKRLQQARQLIAEGRNPGEVSLRCGFQDYANFYRAFRRIYGVSPQQSR